MIWQSFRVKNFKNSLYFLVTIFCEPLCEIFDDHPFFSSHRRALETAFSQRDGAQAEQAVAQAQAQAEAQAEQAAGCRLQGGKIHIFASHLDPVHRIQSKFGMDILLDPRNTPAEEFFIFLNIQDGRSRHYGKLRNRS